MIKDRGSTDNTSRIVMDFDKNIISGCWRLRFKGIRLILLSSRDLGLYDAVMTYVNDDDILHVNAFEVARRVFTCV